VTLELPDAEQLGTQGGVLRFRLRRHASARACPAKPTSGYKRFDRSRTFRARLRQSCVIPWLTDSD
jgi:hypothetical protein